jgi:hypothetical protein
MGALSPARMRSSRRSEYMGCITSRESSLTERIMAA